LAAGAATLEPLPKHPSTEAAMRSLLLLFLGIPIPIIILIALFVH
jgi:hypothetical protein